MNNLLAPNGSALIQAASLMTAAMNEGRVTINPNGSFNVDGIPLAPKMPAGGAQTKVDQKSANKIQFDGMVIIDPDRVGLRYLSQLIQRAGKEIHATDLVMGAYGEPEEVMKPSALLEDGVAVESQDERVSKQELVRFIHASNGMNQ
jgi:hypothetical protein